MSKNSVSFVGELFLPIIATFLMFKGAYDLHYVKYNALLVDIWCLVCVLVSLVYFFIHKLLLHISALVYTMLCLIKKQNKRGGE